MSRKDKKKSRKLREKRGKQMITGESVIRIESFIKGLSLLGCFLSTILAAVFLNI